MTSPTKFANGALFSVAAAALLAAAPSADAASKFLLHIADHGGSTYIPGETKVTGHEEWIEVLAFGNSVHRNPDGSPDEFGIQVNQQDFVIHKPVDKSTPLLMNACATGLLLPAVQIKEATPVNEIHDEEGNLIGIDIAPAPNSVTLNHVQVTGYRTYTDSSNTPREEVSFAYNKIVWTYDQRDQDGNTVDSVHVDLALVMASSDPAFDDDKDGIDNYLDPDDDNDGISDEDELRFGLNPFVDDADDDLDGDGQSNEAEAIANTKMNDASDYFGIKSISRGKVRNAEGEEELRMTVSFPLTAGRNYRLLASPDATLPKEAWIVIDEFEHPMGSPDAMADVELSPAVLRNASRLFFRAEVSMGEAQPVDPGNPVDPSPNLPLPLPNLPALPAL